MDIARLGIALDPAPFDQGTDKVLAALKRIEAAVRGSMGNVDLASKKAGGSFTAMAATARNAASTMRSAFDGMANAVGMLSPKLGFALQTLRGMAAMVGGLASGLRSAATGAAAAGGGFRGMALAIGGTVAVLGTLMIALGAFLAVLAPIIIAVKAIGFVWATFTQGLAGASEFESMTTRFAGMLGSMDKAKEKMASLAKFADRTPFELPEIVKANITLQSLTEGLWASEEAMTMIGDAAAKSGLKIDDYAERIGRVFSGIKNGGEWLEPLRSLAGAGGIEGDVAKKVQEAVKAGKSLADAWKPVTDSLQKMRGQMANLATDFTGRSSTMADAWGKFTRVLGEAILPAAKDIVIDITDAFSKLAEKAEAMKPQLTELADRIVATFKALTQPGGLDAGMKAMGAVLEKALEDGFFATAAKIIQWINDVFGIDLKKAVNGLIEADVWKTIENDIIPRLGTALFNALRNAVVGAFTGIGDFITGGAASATGKALAPSAGGVTGYMSKHYADAFPETTSNSGAATRTVSTPADVAAFQSDYPELPFAADGGGTASGTFSLLPDIGNNTTAIDGLTAAIEGAKMQSGKPAWMLDRAAKDAGPDPGLFSGTPFGDMVDANIAQQQQERATADASRNYVTPKDNSSDWQKSVGEMTTKKALKVKDDPMEAEGRKIMESLRTPSEEMTATIENLQKLKDAGQISAETFTRGVAKAKEDYGSAVDGMTKAAKKAAEDQGSELQKLAKQWTDLAKQIDLSNVAIMQSISTNLTGAITSMIDGTKDAKTAFADMAKAIVGDILKVTTQMLVQYALGQAMGWFTGGATGAITAGIKHDGGMVGGGGPGRSVDASVFRGAERFHLGGMAGLKANEVPIIAERGEAVLTAEQQEQIKGRLRGKEASAPSAGTAVTILNVTDPKQIDEAILRNPDLILNAISRRMPQMRKMLNSA